MLMGVTVNADGNKSMLMGVAVIVDGSNIKC